MPGREEQARRRTAAPPAEAVDGLRSVAPDRWDALVPPGSGPLRHGYLSAWHHAELAGLESRPLLAEDGGALAAAAPGYVYDLDVAAMAPPPLARAAARLRRALPRALTFRVFEIGCPAAAVVPLVRAGGVDEAAAADALLRAALRDAGERGAHLLVVQDFPSAEGATADVLRGHGFTAVPITPTSVVELRWDSFDDYLGAMRSQYRRRARLAFERSEHVRVERVRDFAELAPELARLWRAVFDRATEVKREALPEPFFRDAAALEETSVLVLRRPDGSIASFALLYDDAPVLHFLYTGFEEDAQRESAYFRLLYEIVRDGLERGFERVDLGITTLEPKLDVGAVPVPLWAFVRHRNPLLQRLVGLAAPRFVAPSGTGPRNVFKDGAASV